MTSGIKSENVQTSATLDDVIGNKSGVGTARQTIANLGTQLAGSGAIAAAITAASEGIREFVLHSELDAVSGTVDGQPARVLGPDAGTHTETTAGAGIDNVGKYRWDVGDDEWIRTGDLDTSDTHEADTNNPHSVTAAQISLGNVDNTADADKPVSDATQTALDLKADSSALAAKADATATQTALDAKADIFRQGRPGDSISKYTATKTGTSAAGADPDGATVSTTNYGYIRRLTGAGVVAMRERPAVAADQAFTVRWAILRTTDPTDPIGDAVRFGIEWLDKDYASVGTLTDDTLDNNALIASGRISTAITIGADAGDEGVDFAWPATAVYFVPFVETFGSDGVTDVEIVDWSAPDSAVVGTPVALTSTQIAAIEAAGDAELVDIGSEGTTQIAAVAAAGATLVSEMIEGDISGEAIIFIAPDRMITRTTNGATAHSAETSTNKIMVTGYDFDATTPEYIQFVHRMPKKWDSEPVRVTLHWSHGSTTVNFGTVWSIAATNIRNGVALDATFGTAVEVTDTGGATDTMYITPESADITIAGSPAPEDFVVFQVSRVAGDAADTLAVDATLLGISVEYGTRLAGAAIGLDDRLVEESFDIILSPAMINKAWYEAGYPTVQVEKGWGTGIYQNLYWHGGYLWTQPFGLGTRADVWAGGEDLLVEIIYNQSTSVAPTSLNLANHPTTISDSADDTRRVLLNLDVGNAPYFAGYSQGTQNANQHATERGYDLGTLTSIQTTEKQFNAVAVYQHNGTSDDVYMVQDDAGGSTAHWRIQASNLRHYLNFDIVVGFEIESNDTVDVYQVWARDDYYNKVAINIGTNGRWNAGGAFDKVATEYNLHAMGPLNSIRGKLYALCITNNAAADDIAFSSADFDGFTTRLAPLFSSAVANDFPTIAYPFANVVIPMDLGTETADIPIYLVGKPSTAYEADWNSSGYTTIGTTDANGVLKGALASQGKGSATLSVREVGGSTPLTIADVAIGYVMYVCGESGADGRGSNVTITIPSGSLRKNNVDWTAASNEWWKLYCQYIYDTYSCVVGVMKVTVGGSYFYRNDTSAEGGWSLDCEVAADKTSEARYTALYMHPKICPPHLWLWDIGKNDALLTTTGAQFLSRFVAVRDNFRTTLGNDDIAFHCIASGDNGSVDDALVDDIRLNGQIAGWDAGTLLAAGSFAHLEGDLDGTHFDTEVQKQKAADILVRHTEGNGRAPQYSSGSYSTDEVEIVLTGGQSPMTISAGSDVTGWEVTDDNGARTVSDVSIATMTLTLTCDQTLVGPVTVKWASHDSSIGTTLLDSDGTTPLPPEPFEVTLA